MKQDEFDALCTRPAFQKSVSFADLPLAARHDQTLLYGYDCDRRTWHVYVRSGKIHLYCWRDFDDTEFHKTKFLSWDELIPNKRLYPQYCNYSFCQFLVQNGFYLPFTSFGETNRDGPYYGRIASEN